MTGPAEPPIEPAPNARPARSEFDDAVRTTTSVVVSAVMELVRALRHELDAAQRSGEAFLGRVLGAVSRSLHALAIAARAALLAALFAVIGVVVLSIFLVALLNKLLGDPWGTGLTALVLLGAAGYFALRSRMMLKRVAREGEMLMQSSRK